MKRKNILFTVIILILSFIFFNSCNSHMHVSNDDCITLFEKKKEDFQNAADCLLNNVKSNIDVITANTDMIPEGRKYKYINNLYWITNEDSILLDENDVEFITDFIKDNGILSVTIYEKEQCIEFLLSSSLSEAKTIVYSVFGYETPNKYLWKIKAFDNYWYLGDVQGDTPRE